MGKWKELAGIHTCHADCQKPACVAARQAVSGNPHAITPTKEQVIAWARIAGLPRLEETDEIFCLPSAISLANLAYEAGRKDENEACANVCDRFQERDVGMQPAECAGAIRARREQ